MTDEEFNEKFLAFAKSQKPDETWDFSHPHRCALAQFVKAEIRPGNSVWYYDGYGAPDDPEVTILYPKITFFRVSKLVQIREAKFVPVTWGDLVQALEAP